MRVVNLRVGALRQVVPATLVGAFEIAARGTVCEGARLEHELVPARLLCPACAFAWSLSEPDFCCRQCGGEAFVTAGRELDVESIEVDDPDHDP